MNLTPIFVIALPALTILAVGLAGSTRRIGFWWAVVSSLLLTPVGGIILVILSGPRPIKRRKRRA